MKEREEEMLGDQGRWIRVIGLMFVILMSLGWWVN